MAQNRQNAIDNLGIAQKIHDLPGQAVPMQEAMARFANAQTFIQAAAVHALLDIAAAIRESQTRP